MKKTFVILITVALLGILAATVAPGQKGTATTTNKTAATTVATIPAASVPATSATSATATTPATTGQYKDGNYTGSTASNRFDDIKVAVTISGGKITAISTPTLNGDSGRSQQINSYAIPQLTNQAISAQSSQIDGVSGASYTSEAYVNSLQSALDQAKA
ncbi:MAG TPA: FMN-binding protein [Candidatus Microsaccharimonas sp.]|jgi:uncharacterized protein with FMN-binding domain